MRLFIVVIVGLRLFIVVIVLLLVGFLRLLFLFTLLVLVLEPLLLLLVELLLLTLLGVAQRLERLGGVALGLVEVVGDEHIVEDCARLDLPQVERRNTEILKEVKLVVG